MLRRCVWSRNIKNGCSIYIYDISHLRVKPTQQKRTKKTEVAVRRICYFKGFQLSDFSTAHSDVTADGASLLIPRDKPLYLFTGLLCMLVSLVSVSNIIHVDRPTCLLCWYTVTSVRTVLSGTGFLFMIRFPGLYNIGKVKVKCTLVQALRLCKSRTAHRGSRGIAVRFLVHGTRKGWRVSVKPRPLFTPGKDPVPIVQEAGWAPGPVWTGEENLAHTWILCPDRPARSQSLYRLRYPAHAII